ncbi:MAG: DEAD/DEAH box helicase family protein [Hahellaceae bacterium]|nr:DEAD/DEAH box helicase family protein [Hahellaceae bacterium]
MKLRWYQQEAHDAVYNYFRDGNAGNPLIIAPTGSGKSINVAKLTESVTNGRPTVRVLVLTHQKELIAQNFEKLLTIWPDAPAGINSASLKSRRFDDQIIFASIQSVANHAESLGHFNLVVIDEAHMIPADGEGQYNKLLNGLRDINPTLKVVGLTATPYRLKSGHLIGDDTLFTDVAYEVEMRPLIEEGFLSRLIPKRTKTQINTDGVKKRGGEFIAGDLEKVADEATIAAIPEILKHGKNRKAWIVFCCGVSHAEHVTQLLTENGVSCALITGETSQDARELNINLFKQGHIKCLVNVNVLTTGFDAPHVDMIAVLRPTMSTGLYVQMLGRGMRIADEKDNCLVLDFAGNTERHGPIDCVRKGRKRRNDDDEPGVAPVKTCPQCETMIHASIMLCPECGHEFPKKEKVFSDASNKELLSFEDMTLEPMKVVSVMFSRHKKTGKPDSVKMELFEENAFFPVHSIWLCFDHPGYAGAKATAEFEKWFGVSVTSTNECLSKFGSKRFYVDAEITLRRNGKYFDLVKTQIHKKAGIAA